MTHRTIADSEAFIEMVLRRPENQHAWAIRLQQNPTVIGAIEFGLKNATEADFHYVLAEPFWNRGFMTEAAQSVVAWGRKTHPAVRRISSVAVKQNVASQRIMQKCGLLFQRYVFESWAKLSDPVELAEYALDCGSPAEQATRWTPGQMRCRTSFAHHPPSAHSPIGQRFKEFKGFGSL